MIKYNFQTIERKWQKYWREHKTFKTEIDTKKKKFYALDMFPYPSGSGLHVGHPLGYIATDIVSRYKRLKGYNVLHPMGFDAFGLPAEQYAIETGQHPKKTTEENIKTYKNQLNRIGFSFDWSYEIKTSNPHYYKWTQWIFSKLFNSWYNTKSDKAENILTLIHLFENQGNKNIYASCDEQEHDFSSKEWNTFSETKKEEILLKYRLAYISETEVNWCPYLGTVLANDEIVNGLSERGGHSIVRKKMKQWSMRITAYSERLLDGLNKVDWPQPLKDIQKNWIGRSEGVSIQFKIKKTNETIEIFTTRPDTIFGVSFITLAPEHPLVKSITTTIQKQKIEKYIKQTSKRSERERMSDVKTISGEFTGAYVLHPFTKKEIPIWIGDYILADYGTGAVMAVPAGDQRDWEFAKHFGIEIPNIFYNTDISSSAFEGKNETKFINSDFLDNLSYKKAMKTVIDEIENKELGKRKINYKIRNAIFSRQRYWGEPFPIYYKNGLPKLIEEKYLPIRLPEIKNYLPTEDGEPPLGNSETWAWDTVEKKIVATRKINNTTVFALELNTMPGWAGSSWYFNRYMDVDNDKEFVSKDAANYWKEVDLYIGGAEHATGHLLYARFWQKFLFDMNLVPVDEFAKKLINQGMIMGNIESIYKAKHRGNHYSHSKNTQTKLYGEEQELGDVLFSADLESLPQAKGPIWEAYTTNIPIAFTQNTNDDQSYLDSEGVKKVAKWQELKNPSFITNEGIYCPKSGTFLGFDYKEKDAKDFKFFTKSEIGKISKSKYNVISPDDICEKYGADTLRLYEMFLGPLEQSKPWNTNGIDGVSKFLKKYWSLAHQGGKFNVSETAPTIDLLKILHTTIKKIQEDIDKLSFNTSVSAFMICVNELTAKKCNNRRILEDLTLILSPFSPHIAEEMWSSLGYKKSISTAKFPIFNPEYLKEDTYNYPIMINGKMRVKINFLIDSTNKEIEKEVLKNEIVKKWLEGKPPQKIIIVPRRIINVVV